MQTAPPEFDFLELKNALLIAIVESSDDAIISKTLKGTVTSWNKAAEQMFGYSEEEAKGKNITLIIPEERLEEETFIIGEIRKGNKVAHFHTVRIAKDGTLVYISLSVSPILDNSGNIIGASKIARDISVQQSDLLEKERLLEEIKNLSAKKDEFISLASHELKTPLTSINGYLQILSRIVTDDKASSFLQKSQKQVKNLIELVADLLDVSRIEAGKLNVITENFDIRIVVEDAIELILNANPDHKIGLHSDFEEFSIAGDAHRIEQVIINLLTNAIRYAPNSQQIVVYLNQSDDAVKIGVRDFGMGIPSDKLEHIFSRYYRVEDKNANISGLGVGLFLCKEIIDRHNGSIWAESECGKGSVFWFTLPINRNK